MKYSSFLRPDGTAAFGRLEGETLYELGNSTKRS